jgi:hypothetical protein
MVGRGRIYVPFELSDLREIKKHLDSYADAPDQYIQAFPNLSIDMKGCYASTRPDSFLIRKAMGSGPDHSGWK